MWFKSAVTHPPPGKSGDIPFFAFKFDDIPRGEAQFMGLNLWIIVSENARYVFHPKLGENNVTNGRDLPSAKHGVIGTFVIVIKGGLRGVAPQEDYLLSPT